MTNIRLLSTLIFLLISGSSHSQNHNYEKLVSEFKTCKNDSVFISQNSITPYRLMGVSMPDSMNQVFPMQVELFNADLNKILGPFKTDSSIYYLKITNIDTAYLVNVGNIYLDTNRGRAACIALANEILDKVKSGMDFNIFCIMYTDDKNSNENCSLGNTFNNLFVEPFKTEITKHKLNDVFIVETEYGFHVVKMLSNPVRKRSIVDYVKLELSSK